jgi:hypothetical protein
VEVWDGIINYLLFRGGGGSLELSEVLVPRWLTNYIRSQIRKWRKMKLEINIKDIRIAVEDEPTTTGGSWTMRRVPELPEVFKMVFDGIKELNNKNEKE